MREVEKPLVPSSRLRVHRVTSDNAIHRYASHGVRKNRMDETADKRVVIRPARVKDALAIARVHIESWRATYPGIVPQHYIDSLNVEVFTERWRDRLETHPEMLSMWLRTVETSADSTPVDQQGQRWRTFTVNYMPFTCHPRRNHTDRQAPLLDDYRCFPARRVQRGVCVGA